MMNIRQLNLNDRYVFSYRCPVYVQKEGGDSGTIITIQTLKSANQIHLAFR
jgi:hypothetical protein